MYSCLSRNVSQFHQCCLFQSNKMNKNHIAPKIRRQQHNFFFILVGLCFQQEHATWLSDYIFCLKLLQSNFVHLMFLDLECLCALSSQEGFDFLRFPNAKGCSISPMIPILLYYSWLDYVVISFSVLRAVADDIVVNFTIFILTSSLECISKSGGWIYACIGLA